MLMIMKKCKKNVESLQKSRKELSVNLQAALDVKEQVENDLDEALKDVSFYKSKCAKLEEELTHNNDLSSHSKDSTVVVKNDQSYADKIKAFQDKEKILLRQLKYSKETNKKIMNDLKGKIHGLEVSLKDSEQARNNTSKSKAVEEYEKNLDAKDRIISDLEMKLDKSKEVNVNFKRQMNRKSYTSDKRTDELENEIEHLKSTIEEHKLTIEKLNIDLEAMREENKDVDEMRQIELESSIEDLTSKLEIVLNEKRFLERTNQALEKEMKSKDDTIMELEDDCALFAAEATASTNDNALAAVRDKCSQKIEEILSELNIEKKMRMDLEKEFNKLKTDYGMVSNSKQAMKHSMEVKINEVRRVISSLENSKNDMKLSMESSVQKKTTKINALVRERDNLRKSLENSSKELEKLKSDSSFGSAKLKAKLNMITQVLVETKMHNDDLMKEVEYLRGLNEG